MIVGLPGRYSASLIGDALVFHALWELVQMHRLYTCWDRWGEVAGWMRMAVAIKGNGFVTLVVTVFVALLTSAGGLLALLFLPLFVLVLLSAVARVIHEWMARRLHLWGVLTDQAGGS